MNSFTYDEKTAILNGTSRGIVKRYQKELAKVDRRRIALKISMHKNH